MIKIHSSDDGIVQIDARGKLDQHDYEEFRPKLDEALQGQAQVNILFRLVDFEGWTAKALVEDVKMDAEYASRVNKVAVVGEKTWQSVLTRVSDWFTGVDMRYFDAGEEPQARAWLSA